MLILKIIDRQPEIYIELIDQTEKLTEPEVGHIKSRTGIFPISKLGDYLSDREKHLLYRAIQQISVGTFKDDLTSI